MGNSPKLIATRLPVSTGWCAAILVLLIVGTATARAQEEYRGTQEQQAACIGDVFNLCWNDIPNVTRIVSCLQREKPRLSAACRAVFDQNAPRTASRRHHRVAMAGRNHSIRYERRSDQSE